LRVAVIHNLAPGGAHRRLSEHISRLDAEVVEVCLASATPVRADARVVALAPLAPRVHRAFRAPLRYADFLALLVAWRRAGALLRELRADVVYANPCRYLQAPPALLSAAAAPSLYFCDEPRRVDSDEDARRSRNALTRPLYGPMYRAERRLDRRAVSAAARLATNSEFTARQINLVYGRRADVLPLGVPDRCLVAPSAEPVHILSVGTLIPSKGHELVIEAAALARNRRPVLIVAPRPDPGEAARLAQIAARSEVALEIRVGVNEEQLAAAYGAAQATLYMARREPYGLASLEAQAVGSPVIVAAEGGLPETIVEGRTGWAVPRSAEAVAHRLDQLERPAVREAMSAAARAHAADRTWTRSARALQEILEQLARCS
jgi:glycosyltransferase involved in cell wall biosynthesis